MSRSVVHVVLTDNFAGTEQLVAVEARALAARGWTVTVVGGDTARVGAAAGPQVRVVPAAGLAAGLAQLARLGRVDVVHAHLTAAEVAAVATRALHRAPVVATRHIAAHRGASRLGHLAAPWVRRGLDQQVAISDFVAAAVGEPCTVVRNGVLPVADAGVPRHPEVLVLQRLEQEKATDVALRVWAGSGLAERGWRLRVAGRGALEGALRQQAAELGVTGSVDFLGWSDDAPGLLDRASVLLAPAPGEPFGLSVAQAMAHGVPVLAADGGAHREVLGGEGRFFPPGDAAAGAAQLRALAADPEQRAAAGSALRARQRDALTVERHVDELERVYSRLLPR